MDIKKFAILLGLCCIILNGCFDDSDDNNAAILAALIASNPAQISQSNIIFSSGITHGGITAESSQSVCGMLPLPQEGYRALLRLNGQNVDINYDSDGIFTLNLTLTPGLNRFKIEMLDDSGNLKATTDELTFMCAGNSAGAPTVTIDNADLSAFPLVSLTVSVNDGGHVAGLTAADFFVVNAGQRMNLSACTDNGSDYTLEYTDITCGGRDLYVFVVNGSECGKSAAQAYGTSYALLTGINTYPDNIPVLANCINDVNDMKTILQASSMYDIVNIYERKETAATKAAIISKIAEIAAAMNKYDSLLFFFSGHGYADGGEYICTYYDDPADQIVPSEFLSSAELATALQGVPDPNNANSSLINILVLLDACYSGNFIDMQLSGALLDPGVTDCRLKCIPNNSACTAENISFAKDLKATTGSHLTVMSASASNEESWDVSSLGNGVFTYYLTKGLGLDHDDLSTTPLPLCMANTDNNSRIGIEEAHTYTAARVSARYSTQHPQLRDDYPDAENLIYYTW